MRALLTSVVIGLAALVPSMPASAGTADTTLTYQGRLKSAGLPAHGTFTMSFSLWDAAAGGTQIGSTITPFAGVAVTNGVFAVNLDFGNQAFNNHDRYLQIVVSGTTLTPRQLVARAPYAIATRGVFVGPTETVGIGVEGPNPNVQMDVRSARVVSLDVQNSSTSGRAVSGFATATSGTTYGVYGLNDSPDGRGVFGWARDTSSSDNAIGVYGQSDSSNGQGVAGRGRYGVVGTSSASLGYGVVGEATGDAVSGVLGTTTATNSSAVSGWWQGDPGSFGTGVEGITGSESGRGVHGIALNSTGFGFGVYGLAYGDEGSGVFGQAISDAGVTYGVYGRSLSPTGIGVFGEGTGPGGQPIGVRGEGFFGVHGSTARNGGVGVYGEATNNGTTAAIRGVTTLATSLAVGVSASCANPAGFDFIANGPGIDYGTTSSIRWKRNIQPIEYPLDKVDQLRGVYYDWDEAHGGKQHDIGMIAEEVGQVIPEIVGYEANGVDAIGMDYSKLTPLLVEAVKALRAENQELRTRIEQLEARSTGGASAPFAAK